MTRNKKYIRFTLILLGSLFFFFLLFKYWSEIRDLSFSINWPIFTLSILVALLDVIVFGFFFKILLNKYSFFPSNLQIGSMYFLGQIAKYIPGSIWAIFYQATFLKNKGAKSAVFFVNIDMMTVAFLRNIIIVIFLLCYVAQPRLSLLILLCGAYPFIIFIKSNTLSIYFLKLPFLKKNQNLFPQSAQSFLSSNKLFILYITTISLYLFSNFLVMFSLGYQPSSSISYISYMSLAWIVGLVTFVFPAGIGVRELTFVTISSYFGSNSVPLGDIVAIAIIYRFWQITHDIGNFLIGLFIKRYSSK